MIKKIINFLNINYLKKKKVTVPKYILSDKKHEKFINITTHKNNVSLIYFPESKTFRKFSNNNAGKKKIYSEYKGYSWYCKKSRINKKIILKKYYRNSKFSFLDLSLIKGKKIKSWQSLENNIPYILKIIKNYSLTKYLNIHGDFTLDNIIFQKNKIFIIDWEFFGSKSVKGYDITYLVLSSICLPYIFNKRFTSEDKKLFIFLWKQLLKQGYNKSMLSNPFKFFEKKIKADLILSKSYKLSKSKFFPFITPHSHKNKILKLINSVTYEQ